MNPTTIRRKQSPPYWLGLLCLIPMVGAFVGVGLLLYGIIKYKDKWLTIIGGAGILWTIVVFSRIFHMATHDPIFTKGFGIISQMQLNSLVTNIEYYKSVHGQYPDSLKQVQEDDRLAPIDDAAQGLNTKGRTTYNYQRIGDEYLLSSSGPDGIPGTRDDLYPGITYTDTGKNIYLNDFLQTYSYVFDTEHDLDTAQKRALDDLYYEHRKRTTNEIALITTASFYPDSNIRMYSMHKLRELGVGRKDINNGLIIVYSRVNRQVRIATGYGTEKVLKDEIAKRIIDSLMIPAFKDDRIYQGLWSGSKAIVDFLDRPENRIN